MSFDDGLLTQICGIYQSFLSLCSLLKRTEAKQKSQGLLDLKDQIIEKLTMLQRCVANQTAK